MERKDDGGAGSKFAQLRRFQAGGGLELDVDELAASVGGFAEDVDFGGDGAFELASAGDAAAGGDGDHVGMGFGELLSLWKASPGLGR